MSYEVSKFGNGVLVGSGGNVVQTVHNRFGTQELGQQAGVTGTVGSVTEVTLTLTADQLKRDAATGDGFLIPVTIPKGSLLTRALVQTKDVFNLTGTTPTIAVGTQGSEVTNGITISEAQAEAVGAYSSTLNGTWANPLAADTVIGVALGGTSPVVNGSGGKIDILLIYAKA